MGFILDDITKFTPVRRHLSLPHLHVLCILSVSVVCLIHSVFCLTTGPKPPPKRCLHIVRCRASSFKWEYPLLSLRSSSSFLRLLPRLLATSISPFIFPSITCFRRQVCLRVINFLWCIYEVRLLGYDAYCLVNITDVSVGHWLGLPWR